MKSARDYLMDLRVDWINNYLTLERFAEDHGLTVDEARALIKLANIVASHDHPEA